MITIIAVKHWDENEYEGEALCRYGGRELTCYVQVHAASEWERFTPGSTVEAELKLLRFGEIANGSEQKYARQIQGVEYEVCGQILKIKGEECLLDCGFELPVDLDEYTGNHEQIAQLQPGQWLRLRGRFNISESK